MTIEIRRARLDDATTLTDLSMRSKRSNGYDDAFMDACREELTVTATRMDEGDYWVAEDDEHLCGCACLVTGGDGEIGEVHAFFIDPNRQRQGIGRLLWQRIAEQAKAKRISALRLDADPSAVAFYEALGFKVIGETPSGSIAGRMLPRMEIKLNNPNR